MRLARYHWTSILTEKEPDFSIVQTRLYSAPDTAMRVLFIEDERIPPGAFPIWHFRDELVVYRPFLEDANDEWTKEAAKLVVLYNVPSSFFVEWEAWWQQARDSIRLGAARRAVDAGGSANTRDFSPRIPSLLVQGGLPGLGKKRP